MKPARRSIRGYASGIFRSERHSAAIMLSAAVLGIILANGPAAAGLLGLKSLALPFPPVGVTLTVGEWVSDLLLAVFFFIVAIELKEELTHGELNTVRKALVPTIAAIGGVAAPALIYLLLSGAGGLARGWPVPTATDIAFAVGVLAIFGRFLPGRMRVFLLALAVIDDLIGILFIAVLFARQLDLIALFGAVVAVIAFCVLSRLRRGNRWLIGAAMIIVAVITWLLVQRSGIHPTIAGVALGLAMAATPGRAAAHHLAPWSSSIILPLFAFSAAVVVIPDLGQIGSVFFALAIALPLGKAIGITVGGLIGAHLARTHLAAPIVGWDLIALAVTGGLGFTVALLMGQLAFHGDDILLDESVLGVLTGSGIALVLGGSLIAWRSRIHRRRADAIGLADSTATA